MSRAVRRAALALLCVLVTSYPIVSGAAPVEALPPSPYSILGMRVDELPEVDAVSPCLPDSRAEDGGVRRLTRKGDYEAALRRLEALRKQGGDALEGEMAVTEAILRARVARAAKDDARRQLVGLLRKVEGGRSLACIQLEIARLDLRTHRAAEAGAWANRALRAFGGEAPPASVGRAAGFYRAEALQRAASVEAARELLESLAQGGTPVARAAALRLADLSYRQAPGSRARKRVEARLADLGSGFSRSEDWAARLAEWALRDGDTAESLAWLERVDSSRPPELNAAVTVRRADALYLLGRSKEGGKVLSRLADSGMTESARQLAMVRLIDLERPAGVKAIRQLGRAARSPVRGLSLYARRVLVEQLLAAGRTEEAMDVLVGLVFEAASPEIVPGLPALVDEVLAILDQQRDCSGLLATLGGRRTLLLRHASHPDPFLRLGDCYLEFGMSHGALDTYRGVTKGFAGDVTKRLTLRTARAEFETGSLARARAAAQTSLRRVTLPVRDWRLLYAEIMLVDGRPEETLRALEPVLRNLATGPIESEEEWRAVWLFARASVSLEPASPLRALLRRALTDRDEALKRSPRLAESALLAGDVHRLAGEDAEAVELYGAAMAALPPGPMRSRAGYWQAALTRDIDTARAIWALVAEADDSWARLAATELVLGEAREAVGRPATTPRPARAVTIAGTEQ